MADAVDADYSARLADTVGVSPLRCAVCHRCSASSAWRRENGTSARAELKRVPPVAWRSNERSIVDIWKSAKLKEPIIKAYHWSIDGTCNYDIPICQREICFSLACESGQFRNISGLFLGELVCEMRPHVRPCIEFAKYRTSFQRLTQNLCLSRANLFTQIIIVARRLRFHIDH